jgi:chloramphenicol O-acetyltransferase
MQNQGVMEHEAEKESMTFFRVFFIIRSKGGCKMAKKKKQRQQASSYQVEKETVSLGEHLDSTLFQQLKQKQKKLAEEAEQKRLEELERKKRELREREKNKSFEELLNESSLSWKDFK